MILLVLFLLILATDPTCQAWFSSKVNLTDPIVYAITLFLAFLGLRSILHRARENFYFQVGDDLQKCTGPYKGQATTFEYNAAGGGKCGIDPNGVNAPMGYINPNGASPYYGGAYSE